MSSAKVVAFGSVDVSRELSAARELPNGGMSSAIVVVFGSVDASRVLFNVHSNDTGENGTVGMSVPSLRSIELSCPNTKTLESVMII
jgi:hypothetical protein